MIRFTAKIFAVALLLGFANNALAGEDEVKEKVVEVKKLTNHNLNFDFKKMQKLEVLPLVKPRFDDTGLVLNGVKYFIRIWKHPPKELFTMPTLKPKPPVRVKPKVIIVPDP